MSIAVKVENLWKSYSSSPVALKRYIVGMHRSAGSNHYNRDWAIQDVSFEVERGESFAIVGHNGTGKSTLLGIILKTISPERGNVSVNGKIVSMLELGAGFHPELSGLDNIYLYGSINGLTISQIRKRIAKIIEFSELGSAINNQIRTFSSGMIARLAFAVIANIEPEIILIDEVLSVGDLDFRKKCINFLNDFKERSGTLIIVSHEFEVLKTMCSRGVLLEGGRLVACATLPVLLDHYSHMTKGVLEDGWAR